MATETYYQFSSSKKERIMEAMIDEFSAVSFSLASINKIIKQAKISRGSFYQYFKDKEDCYLEMLKQIAQEKMELFKDVVALEPEASVFDHYMHMINQIEIWMLKRPKYFKVSMHADFDKSDFIQKLSVDQPDLGNYFLQLIKNDIKRGIIKESTDPQLLSDVLNSINKSLLLDYFKKEDYQGMSLKTESILAIIKNGVLNPLGEKHV